jgi:DNA-binding helix-hairpin-helix protein with protein kinase domain
MATYVSQSGKRYITGNVLGKGGEGQVFHVEGHPDLALKIYNPAKAVERKEKIQAMVAAGLAGTSNYVAYPKEVVNDQSGKFAGFTMKKVTGFKSIHDLYGPGSRKNEFPKADVKFLVRAALNLASAVASIHGSGCVIGDINHSGILVSDQALATLIDADSFQFRHNNKTYRSLVGVAEYTPPELQGMSFDTTDRTSNHDAFGLAVMLFQLLFLGRHPFAGRFLGKGDMDIKKAISERRFAYSARRSETQMEPPPYVPVLNDYGDEIKEAFERAFSRSAELGGGRPSAGQWVSMLRKLEANLTACSIDKSHSFYRGKRACVWCTLESQTRRPLFQAQLIGSSSTINIGELIDRLNALQPPSTAPDAEKVMPPLPHLQRSRRGDELKAAVRRAMIGAAVGTAGGLFLMYASHPMLGTIATGVSVVGFFAYRGQKHSEAQSDYQHRLKDWQEMASQWAQAAGPDRFHQRREFYRQRAREHSRLPQVEAQRLAELEQKKRELQLRKHLENHLIDRAKINNIGDARKALLAAYGIETAYDAKNTPITNIPGFGPALQSNLMAWVIVVERKFVFNPSIPTDPQAIRDVKNEIAKTRAEIERDLNLAHPELMRIRDEAIRLRTNPPQLLIDTYKRMLQAKKDYESL